MHEKYMVGLATEWMNENAMLSRLTDLKKQKLRQAWFADFDSATSSSIFFCYMPDGLKCNILGNCIFQSGPIIVPDDVKTSESAFRKLLKSKGTLSATCSTFLSVRSNEPTEGFVFRIKGFGDEFTFELSGVEGQDIEFLAKSLPKEMTSALAIRSHAEIISLFEGRGIEAKGVALDDVLNWRRQIFSNYLQAALVSLHMDLAPSDVLDLSRVHNPFHGFEVMDAVPTDDFIEWFHGDSSEVPVGRSLLCNIPLKKPQEGNLVCVYLDHFNHEFRFVLCCLPTNAGQMQKVTVHGADKRDRTPIDDDMAGLSQ